jgi:Icc-related predicted phosphoesterase
MVFYPKSARPERPFPLRTLRVLTGFLVGGVIVTKPMRVVLLAAVAGLLVFSACEQKTTPPPKVAEKPVEAPKAPPPIAAPEPLADKECAAPIDPGPGVELKFGDRVGKTNGARLVFGDKDADGKLSIGVLGPINEDSGQNILALRQYVKFFAKAKVDAIIVDGDVGERADGIARVLKELAVAKVPVLVNIGNNERRGDFTDGVKAAAEAFPNVINLTQIRVVSFPELTLISLPGYHDPTYFKCQTSCQYLKSTLDEVVREAKAQTTPVLLIAHGPPRGKGDSALDFATGSGGNVGDEGIAKAIATANISFGVFANIKEAGGRAARDPDGTQLVKKGEPSPTLFLNPGPADATTPWDMNDGTKAVGMAAVFTLSEGKASWDEVRLKPLTAAEKAEAKKLSPAP